MKSYSISEKKQIDSRSTVHGGTGLCHQFYLHDAFPLRTFVLLTVAMSSTVLASTLAPRTTWIVPSRKVHVTNPLKGNEYDIAMGHRLYEEHCLVCHGASGHGDGKMANTLEVQTSDLTVPSLWSQTDGELYYKITKGRKPMPGYSRMMSEKERWRVISYMRSLAPKPNVVPARFIVSNVHREAISAVFVAYQQVHAALVKNDMAQAQAASTKVATAVTALSSVGTLEMPKGIDKAWRDGVKKLTSATEVWMAEDGETFSSTFGEFSRWLADFVRQFGHSQPHPILLFSSMMPDKTSNIWLQTESVSTNPYNPTSSKSTTTLLRKLGTRTLRESKLQL